MSSTVIFMLVAGLDGCKGGWVGVVLRDGRLNRVDLWHSLEAVVEDLTDASAIAVDIPIGLPEDGPRSADLAAREFVGPRRSSVFPVPPRAVLEAATYEEAVSVSRKLAGKGITRQSWALRDKILEADSVAAADSRVREVHPEVSFCAMAGAPLLFAKRTWNGQAQRKALLKEAGIALLDDIGGSAGSVPVDDVLDAAACAWSALRIGKGEAKALPEGAKPGEPRISF